ncbi:hypothetical protein ANCCEY_00140 [Ancylostoma ceylanicum]|uniref:Uncharacterized protein n=1 Tax=Ancylostoma ceylanicum TaxID=53326 RepID=A0A0D6M995_9BILA|nr:hypothetical protein ANCCEY_00140 [Ancylostoma ceylanicum]
MLIRETFTCRACAAAGIAKIPFSCEPDATQLAPKKSDLLVFAMKKKIFCEGSLLDAVQRANLFADCKHFVDMPLKQDAVHYKEAKETTELLRNF